MRSAKIDMTRGNVIRNILLFGLPICIGAVLQQLYNTVDTIVVGNFCGPISIAAVGTSAQPVDLLMCLFLGMGTGVSILVSQHTGSGDIKSLRELTATATAFLYAFAVPLTVIGWIFGPAILRMMNVPEDTMSSAVTYMRIIFLGTLGSMGYNFNAGILRGLGDSKSSLIFLSVCCAVNIVLDIFTVAVLHLDVAGAAAATIIAMFASWFLSIIYIIRKYPELNFRLLPHSFNKKIALSVIRMGLPLGLNNSLYSFGHIVLQTFINEQGSTYIAGCSIATRVVGIANIAIGAFSSAATTFSGQNYGASDYQRLTEGMKKIPLFSGTVSAVAGILFSVFCMPILRLFTGDQAVLDIAAMYVRIVLPVFWTYAVLNSILCFANGIGDVKFPTVVSLLMLWVFRIPTAYYISHFVNGRYLIAAYPISYFLGMLCMVTYVFTPKWKSIKKKAAEQRLKTEQMKTS